MHEALFYEKIDDNKVQCFLCQHNCKISLGKKGICRVRENINGRLYSLSYGKIISQALDPIEKKPLYHFYPGTVAYSIASLGCNFSCLNCQNWTISQVKENDNLDLASKEISAQDLLNNALATNAKSIAYTYTEPTIFYEYVLDSAKISQKKGLKNVFITNGYIGKDALKEGAAYIDAANIDLKSINDDFYHKICGASLAPVLENIKLFYQLGIWIELTTLIIPGYNDSIKELEKIAKFIKDIDKSIPWHVSRFYPTYKLKDVPSTTEDILYQALDLGKKIGLEYIYIGNIGSEEITYCPKCKKALIIRQGFVVKENNIKSGGCAYCNNKIAGRW